MKILILKNNYKKKLDIKKGLEHLKKNTPLSYEVEELSCNIPLQFKKVGNATFGGVVPDGYYQELRKIVPEGKYDVVVMFYDQDTPGIRVAITENVPLYPDTDMICMRNDDKGGKTFNHEMFHVFFKKLARRGVNLYDPMDVAIVKGKGIGYYNNECLDCEESNRTIALAELKPYWKVITNPISQNSITLKRESDDGIQTLGTLTVNKNGVSFAVKSLELSWKENAKNISCIPKGTYDVVYSFSPSFLKYTYEIKNVPNRSGIRIHSANYASQLKGCIALGTTLTDINHDGKLDTTNSTVAIKAFEQLMDYKPFKLTII